MMRQLFTTIGLAAAVLFYAGFAQAEKRYVYLSAGGEVTVFEADLKTGKLTGIQKNPGAGLTAVDSGQKHLYRVGGNEIESYVIQKNGKLLSLGKKLTTAKGGFLAIDAADRFIAGNDYGGGSVAIWEIGDDGVAGGDLISQVCLEKATHSSVFSPNNGFLLAPATTPNKVFQLRFNAEIGKLAPNDPPFVSGPEPDGKNATQPRHLRFHPNGKIVYTTLERELPGVGVWEWDADSGNLKLLQNISTFPEDWEGMITTADLHLTPDSKFLYVSNRDLTDRKATSGDSSIVRFSVNEKTGLLTLLGKTPCEHVPRSFAVDRAGEFAYVAGQSAGLLGVYSIDRDSGDLTRVQQLETGKGPNWVLCVTLK